MTPGYKTSEGWIAIIIAVLGMGAAIYGIHPVGHVDADHDHAQCIKEAVLGFVGAVSAVVAAWKYTDSRTALKGTTLQVEALKEEGKKEEEEGEPSPREPFGFAMHPQPEHDEEE